MGASKRRKLSPPQKEDHSRKIGSLIGSGENCRRNSDFALPGERDTTRSESPSSHKCSLTKQTISCRHESPEGTSEISRWCKPPVRYTKLIHAPAGAVEIDYHSIAPAGAHRKLRANPVVCTTG